MRPLILDSGAVSRLARIHERPTAIVDLFTARKAWAPVVPSLVLVECLSGRQHTDAMVNRFLRTCQIVDGPSERLARRAGALRTLAERGSAVDAVVVAMAEPDGAVLTTDLGDCRALAAYAHGVRVMAA